MGAKVTPARKRDGRGTRECVAGTGAAGEEGAGGGEAGVLGGDLAYRAGMTPLTAGIPPKQSLDGPPDLVAEVVGAGEFGERTLRFAPVEDF